MATFTDKGIQIIHESAELALERFPMGVNEACESPIEKLMAIALWSRGEWSKRLVMHGVASVRMLEDMAAEELAIQCAPQVEVEGYRVDFLAVLVTSQKDPVYRVAIECDGHDFHEKTKEQAARDKARDRTLTAAGITVMRFTGSEIWKDAGACADEVLNVLWSKWHDAVERGHFPERFV
jgi:very-short-patch-repair endonuclease